MTLNRIARVWLILLTCLLPPLSRTRQVEEARGRPNVLFVAIDDMNDSVQLLDPSAPIKTPNLQRLASRGVLFSRAYAASSACNPSRVALLTGLRPSTSGVYGNATDWRRALPDAVTLPQHFMAHGYEVAGAGKIFHHHLDGAFHDDASFEDFQPMPNPPDAPMPRVKLNHLPDYGSPNTDWGAWPEREEDAVDYRTADYAIDFLSKRHDRPFFLAVGIFRPHMPFFAPERFFDEYPAGRVTMPEMFDDDWDDLPAGARTLLEPKLWFFRGMREAERKISGSWRNAVRAYQASATFADAQIGRVMGALDASPYSGNTVIVLWSDHGYHLGEKEHWEKFALWEKTTHVPYIIVGPGVTKGGSVCQRPVDLMSVYPTLIDLCGLPSKPELDGVSVLPLLKAPAAAWKTPALTTYMRDNHAVRTERWRYIRYADGSEELYDHTNDPHEWHNLASLPEHEKLKRELGEWLPESGAEPAPPMNQPRRTRSAPR